jgi:flagellar protein FlgJ
MRVDARPLPLSPPPANDAAQIDKVARQMEGLFAQMMIKQMRETALGDTMFPGAAGQFRELYDEQIAKSLTEGKGLGLSTMIARQLTREAGGGAEEPRITRQQPISSRENRQEGVESSSSFALHLSIRIGKPAEAGALKLGCQKLESAGSARRQER